MTIHDVLLISSAILASLGGGAFIVLAFSSWLGRVWADRLMQKQQAVHAQDLEHLRANLVRETNTELEFLRKQLDLTAASHLREVNDKLGIYRGAVDIIAETLADFDRITWDGAVSSEFITRFQQFNQRRMQAYGYMAMLAPQSVMDAFDSLVDHLLQVSNGQSAYEWPEVRRRVLILLNEVRKDVGLDKSPIEYRGRL